MLTLERVGVFYLQEYKLVHLILCGSYSITQNTYIALIYWVENKDTMFLLR